MAEPFVYLIGGLNMLYKPPRTGLRRAKSMIRKVGVLTVLTLLALVPVRQAAAQNNTLGGAIIGGGVGAVIGGAATGRAGGAVAGGIVGAAAGAASGPQLEPRGRYFWYAGRCWRKHRDGSYPRVPRHYSY